MHAFGDPASQEENSAHAEDAKKLREEMKNAKGVFLVLDSQDLHNGLSEELQGSLFYLANYMRQKGGNSSKKLAVIFSKSDFFKQVSIDPEEIFKIRYPNAYNNFEKLDPKLDTKYFFVTSIKDPLIKDGKYLPPKDYNTSQTDGIIEAALWMLDIKDKSFLQELKEKINTDFRGRFNRHFGIRF